MGNGSMLAAYTFLRALPVSDYRSPARGLGRRTVGLMIAGVGLAGTGTALRAVHGGFDAMVFDGARGAVAAALCCLVVAAGLHRLTGWRVNDTAHRKLAGRVETATAPNQGGREPREQPR